MPLSDWDVLAIDEQGRPSNGTSETSPAGVRIDPYEGRLQLAGAELWHPLSTFAPPQIGTVGWGDVALLDVRVLAEPVSSGPGGAARGFVWATWFVRGADVVATVGVSVLGFNSTGTYVGVTAADVGLFREVLARWAKEGRMPRELAELGTGGALRFNQGDAFFAKKLGHACSATPPGEAELPVLYHTQRREAIEPHIVRRDPGADTLPLPPPKSRSAPKRPSKRPPPKHRPPTAGRRAAA
jgi:hypothetical protein